MTGPILILWLLLSALGVLACGLFAGLETGIYSLTRVRVHLLSQDGHRRAARLEQMLAEPGPLLATLLIGTNIATNLATAAMGVIFEARGFSTWQVVAAVVLIETPLLLIFAETLPKDLFAAHADRFVYPFVTPILWLKRLLTVIGLLPLITAVSRLFLKSLGGGPVTMPFHPRRHVITLVKEGLGRGLLSDEQTALVERAMALADRTVTDEMTPWSQVITIDAEATPQAIWDLAEHSAHTRFPVVDRDHHVVGVVGVNTVLQHDPGTCPPLADLMTTAPQLAPDVPLRTALRQVQRGAPMAIVTAGAGPLGIVTVKDLIEPVTGKLTNW